MAIQLTKTTISGVTVTDAVHKVLMVTVQSGGCTAFQLALMVDNTSVAPVEISSYAFNSLMSGDCIFKQCYDYLKTLPEYAGAIDV